MNVNMLDRLPRHQTPWPSSLSSRSRAVTEARELTSSANQKTVSQQSTNQSTGFSSSFALEHPKQQPCRYATALKETALSPPRSVRSRTVMPSPATASSSLNTSGFRSSGSNFGSLRYCLSFRHYTQKYTFNDLF